MWNISFHLIVKWNLIIVKWNLIWSDVWQTIAARLSHFFGNLDRRLLCNTFVAHLTQFETPHVWCTSRLKHANFWACGTRQFRHGTFHPRSISGTPLFIYVLFQARHFSCTYRLRYVTFKLRHLWGARRFVCCTFESRLRQDSRIKRFEEPQVWCTSNFRRNTFEARHVWGTSCLSRTCAGRGTRNNFPRIAEMLLSRDDIVDGAAT